MASRTQIRVQQLTGSLATAAVAGAINTSLAATSVDAIDANSLQGILGHAFSAIKRIHGKSGNDATGNDTGTFYTNILPSADGTLSLGSAAAEFGTANVNNLASAIALGVSGSSVNIDALKTGVINIGTSAGVPSNTTAINIGSTAGQARTITIGNDTATKVDVNAAIIELDSAGTIVLNSTTTTDIDSTDNLSLNAAGSSIINIGNDDNNGNINIGINGTRTITIGEDGQDDKTLAVHASAADIVLDAGVNAVAITGGLTTTGNATVGGNLTVNGTTTTVNSVNVTVDDRFIALAGNAIDLDTDAGMFFMSASNIGARPDVAFGKVQGTTDTFALGSIASASGSIPNLTGLGLDQSLRVGQFEVAGGTNFLNITDSNLTIAAAVDLVLSAAGDDFIFDNGTANGLTIRLDASGDVNFKDVGGDTIFKMSEGKNALNIPFCGNNLGDGAVAGGLLSFGAVDNVTTTLFARGDALFFRSNDIPFKLPNARGNANQVLITDGAGSGEQTLSFIDVDGLITDTQARTSLNVKTTINAGVTGLILTASDHLATGKPSHMFEVLTGAPYTGSIADACFALGANKFTDRLEFYVNGQLLSSGSKAPNNGGVTINSGDYVVAQTTASVLSASFAFNLEKDDIVTIAIR